MVRLGFYYSIKRIVICNLVSLCGVRATEQQGRIPSVHPCLASLYQCSHTDAHGSLASMINARTTLPQDGPSDRHLTRA